MDILTLKKAIMEVIWQLATMETGRLVTS